MNIVDMIMAYEDGSLDSNELIDMFSHMKKTNSLIQTGSYLKQFDYLVKQGYLDEAGNVLMYVEEEEEESNLIIYSNNYDLFIISSGDGVTKLNQKEAATVYEFLKNHFEKELQ